MKVIVKQITLNNGKVTYIPKIVTTWFYNFFESEYYIIKLRDEFVEHDSILAEFEECEEFDTIEEANTYAQQYMDWYKKKKRRSRGK